MKRASSSALPDSIPVHDLATLVIGLAAASVEASMPPG